MVANQPIRPRELVLHALLLTALLALVFPGTFLRGEMISPGALLFESPPWNDQRTAEVPIVDNRLTADALSQFHLWFALVKDAINRDEWPLWNPTEYGGLPLLANFQSTVFYPPRLLHAAFDLHMATTLYILLKLWLCGMTSFFCGCGLGLSVRAARFFSVSWMLGSYNLVWAYWPLPDVAIWAPILFWSVEQILAQRYRRGLFGMAFSATLLLLAGHPETAFTMALGMGAYFFVRQFTQVEPPRVMLKQFAACAVAWAMALTVCAAQLLPFIEYLPRSHTFGHRPELDAGAFSLPFDHVAALWVPCFFGLTAKGTFWGWEDFNSNFVGMVFAGLGVWLCAALLMAPGDKRRGLAPLALVGGACLLLAFDIPLFNALKRLPLVSSLWHFYFASFAMLALPLLAAHGLDHWSSQSRSMRDLARPVALAAVTVAIPMFLFVYHRERLATLSLESHVFVSIAVALLVVFAIGSALLFTPARLMYAVAGIVVTAELIYATSPLHPTVPRRFLYPETELTTYLSEPAVPKRVSVKSAGFPAELGAGILPAYGVHQLWGYDGITPNRILGFLNLAGDPVVWGRVEPIAAIEYYLFRDAPDDWSPGEKFVRRASFNGLGVWQNRRAWARTTLVPSLRRLLDEGAVLENMAAPGFDPSETVLTDSDLVDSFDGSLGESASAEIVQYSANRVTVDVDASGPCVLILSDAYDPGWRAAIDGTAAAVFPAYHAFRGVIVPEGKHEVLFEYTPRAFRLGLWISLFGMTAGNVAGVAVLIARHRHA